MADNDDLVGRRLAVYEEIPAASSSGKQDKEKPDSNLEDYYDTFDTDPIVQPGVDQKAEYAFGAGFIVKFYEIGTNIEVDPTDVIDVVEVLRKSKPTTLIFNAGRDGMIGGSGYIEKICLNPGKEVSPQNPITELGGIPPKKMTVVRDANMNVVGYIQDLGGDRSIPFMPDKVAHYRHRARTGEAHGISDVRAVMEYANVMRDLILDNAEFVETKAFSPILWKLGTDDKPWPPKAVREFISGRTTTTPGEHIGVAGDVTAETIGVDKGTLDVTPTLDKMSAYITNGVRTPIVTTSLPNESGTFGGEKQLESYDRHILTLRNNMAEMFEQEILEPLLMCYGHDDIRAEVVWNKHSDEQRRMDTNSTVQLVQNNIITLEYSLVLLGLPKEAREGTFWNDLQAKDNPEGQRSLDDEGAAVDENEKEDVNDEDGRENSPRKA